MPGNDCAAFYQERDQRTREIAPAADVALARPIGLRVGEDAASTRAGQIAALAAINMLSRVHRTIHIEAPTAPLLARPIVDAPDLAAALLLTARSVDPCGQFELGPPPGTAATIGIGVRVPLGCIVYAGARGACGVIDTSAVAIDQDALLGAGLSACLACAAVFRAVVLGQAGAIARKTVSAWNVGEDGEAASGPAVLPLLDVGDVWMIGGGAVGSAVGYWLREFGNLGRWIVIDGDTVKLHNTNRSLLFLPAHAGWGGSSSKMKAGIVAEALRGRAVEDWLDAWTATDPGRPDLVLPLANEHGARHAVAALGLEVVLHATTSRLGAAQLHRHVADADDCVTCRMPGTETVTLGCSAAPVLVGQSPIDAALPFMSGGAGLLLVAALHQLQQGGLLSETYNQRSIDFLSPHRMTQRNERKCHSRCVTTIDRRVRARLNAGRRWEQGLLRRTSESSS